MKKTSMIWKDMVQTRASIEREYVHNIISFIMHPSEQDNKHIILLRVLDNYPMYTYTDDFAGFAKWFIDTLNYADECNVSLEFIDATNAIREKVFK